jgi:hypothetical protein
MLTPRSSLSRRVAAAFDASPSRIPVLLGGCGSGRTTLLRQIHDRIGRASAQYVDVEHSATTPERFLSALVGSSPFAAAGSPGPGARAAFDRTLEFLDTARPAQDGAGPATFLLDEFLELRTFENFPGLRQVLHELADRMAASGNRFVLTSRYAARTMRLLRTHSARFEVMHIPPFTAEETTDLFALSDGRTAAQSQEADFIARTVQALADGRPAYVRALVDEMASMRARDLPGGADAIGALVGLLAPGGHLARHCGFCYELRLHRARGYGALKAILDILAEDEGLTLTEISNRLHRTPGSTKDYLSWLEDVDLVTARHKRYSFSDPLLRLWVRLHCRATAPTDEEIAREVHGYAAPRLPVRPEPAMAMATSGAASPEDERRAWGIIEID